MAGSWRCSFGSYVFAVVWYFGLHSTPVWTPFYALQQPLTACRSNTEEAGIICILEKVYGSLTAENLQPRCCIDFKESAMVHITVLKMTSEKGSPWYTPVFRGIDWDVQSGKVTRACKPQCRSVSGFLSLVGALQCCSLKCMRSW